MTAPNSNLEFIDSSEFLLSLGITAPKSLYLLKILVPKGSLFCDKRRFNFQAFA